LPQIVKILNSPTRLPNGKTRKLALEEALGDAIVIKGLLGRDVPLWLQQHTGWRPSISTIRRRAKELNLEFSVSNPVPRKTLDTLLDLAYAA
ncbi:MAG: hypothetical protein ACKPEQ_05200, partial [Dolichospermum sp.]